MLTTFQRDTYPFLIRCLFVCFSVIVRFSSPKRPLLLHRHKPFVANRPAPVFRETGSLPLRAVPTATHHGDCRQQRSVGREIGKRTACRQTMFVELESGGRVHQHVNSQCRLSRTGCSHGQHREIPTPNAIELPFFADFLQRMLEGRQVYPVTRQHAVDTGQGRMLVGIFCPHIGDALVGGIDAVGNGKGSHLRKYFLPFLRSFFRQAQPVRPFQRRAQAVAEIA